MGTRSINLELTKIQLGQDKTIWDHLEMLIPSTSAMNHSTSRALHFGQLVTQLKLLQSAILP